mmetsp:Transcript_74984/g.175976  ORF Transcript_74984/g.175976 Transcript_74984/m.175976 type:complete len:201 (+) Transcript_74984:68-670(+)
MAPERVLHGYCGLPGANRAWSRQQRPGSSNDGDIRQGNAGVCAQLSHAAESQVVAGRTRQDRHPCSRLRSACVGGKGVWLPCVLRSAAGRAPSPHAGHRARRDRPQDRRQRHRHRVHADAKRAYPSNVADDEAQPSHGARRVHTEPSRCVGGQASVCDDATDSRWPRAGRRLPSRPGRDHRSAVQLRQTAGFRGPRLRRG